MVQVEEVLRAFATAFDTGDEPQLRTTLSPLLWAISLSVSGKGQAAYGRDDAVRFLRERHEQGDRLEFQQVHVNELAGWDGAAQFGPVTFSLERGGATITLDGKGELYCDGPDRGIGALGLTEKTSRGLP